MLSILRYQVPGVVAALNTPFRVPAMLMQNRALQLVMRQRCSIESFYALYDCANCKTEVPVLTSCEDDAARRCPICGDGMRGRADASLREAR